MKLLMEVMIKWDTEEIRAFLTTTITSTFYVMWVIALAFYSCDTAG
jgi:hypothetical protein